MSLIMKGGYDQGGGGVIFDNSTDGQSGDRGHGQSGRGQSGSNQTQTEIISNLLFISEIM